MNLTLSNVTKSYGEKHVLEGVSHTFAKSGGCVISGPSGCGKTTLLRLILGLETPDSGKIVLPEGARISAVFQEDRLIAGMTARDNVALVCERGELPARIDAHIEAVGLQAASKTRASELSGGMRRRTAIARAVIVRPDILLLDEPFTGLDDDIRRACASYIREHMQGKLLLLVTHDLQEAALLGCSDTLRLTADGKQGGNQEENK